jgi:hypothetical protein
MQAEANGQSERAAWKNLLDASSPRRESESITPGKARAWELSSQSSRTVFFPSGQI